MGRHPYPVFKGNRGGRSRIHAFQFFLQCRRRPLRPLPRSRLRTGGDAVPLRRFRALSDLREPTFQTGNFGRNLAGQVRRRPADHQHQRCPAPIRRISQNSITSTNLGYGRTGISYTRSAAQYAVRRRSPTPEARQIFGSAEHLGIRSGLATFGRTHHRPASSRREAPAQGSANAR